MNKKIQCKLTAFLLILSVLLSIICMPITALEADPAATGTDTDASLSDPFALNPEPIETEDQIFERLTADSFMLNYIDEAAFRAAGHINRLPEEEDLSSYVFENEDGTRTAYILNEPVKYIDSTGAVREKDLTLSQGQMGNASVMATGVNTEAYTITATNTPMTFPGELTHGVHFTYGDYTITLRPETVNPSTKALQAEGKVLYRNAFGSTAHLMYTPQLNGLKEDIVLTRYSTQNTFTFILNTDGMSVARDAGGCYLYDGTDEEAKLRLGQVISYDANGDFSIGEMTVTHQSGNTYLVTLTVDPDFLENAFYPVTVDPTLTVSDALTGANSIEDIVILEGNPNAVYSSMQYNTVGYSSSSGRGRTLFRLSGLYTNSAYRQIYAPQQLNYVKFYVYDYSSVTSTLVLHPMTDNTWTENNATWTYYHDAYISEYSVSASLSVNGVAEFDLTNLVEYKWKENVYDQTAGFMLKGADETIAKKIYSSENTNTAKLPYVVMNYDNHVQIAANDNKYFKEGETRTLTAEILPSCNTISWESDNPSVVALSATSGASVTATALQPGSAQITATATFENGSIGVGVFELTVVYDGIYMIGNPTPISEKSYSLQVNGELKPLISTKSSNAIEDKIFCYWYIEHRGNGRYTIRSVIDYSLFLTVTDFENKTIALTQRDTTNISTIGNDALWYIRKNGYWIEIVSAADTTGYLSATGIVYNIGDSSDKDDRGQDLKLANSSEQMEHRSWSFSKVQNSGILFKRIDAAKITFEQSFVKSIAASPFMWLEDFGYELLIYAASGIEVERIVWTSSNPAKIWISSDLGVIKMLGVGTTTLSATAAFSDGTTATVSYTLTVDSQEDGAYYLRNCGSGLFAGLIGNYNQTNNRSICQHTPNQLKTPRLLIKHASDEYYIMHVYISGVHYVVATEGNSVVLTAYPSNNAFSDRMLFKFDSVEDNKYIIKPKSGEASNLAVTAPNTVKGFSLTLSAYSTSNERQQWRLVPKESDGNGVYSVSVEVLYDNGYAAQYDDKINRINSHLLDAELYYLSKFGVCFDFLFNTNMAQFTSYSDNLCSNTKCVHNKSDANCHAQSSYIHDAMLDNGYGTNVDFVVAFIGHDLCSRTGALHGNCSGIHFTNDDWCLVEGGATELFTFIHELGHVLGAPDHYGSEELGTPSTDTLNKDESNEYYLDGYKYNQYCIYGEDSKADSSGALCDGCRYQIRTYVYVSKLINGTEQIG